MFEKYIAEQKAGKVKPVAGSQKPSTSKKVANTLKVKAGKSDPAAARKAIVARDTAKAVKRKAKQVLGPPVASQNALKHKKTQEMVHAHAMQSLPMHSDEYHFDRWSKAAHPDLDHKTPLRHHVETNLASPQTAADNLIKHYAADQKKVHDSMRPTHPLTHPRIGNGDIVTGTRGAVEDYNKSMEHGVDAIHSHIAGVEDSKSGSDDHKHHMSELKKHVNDLHRKNEHHTAKMHDHTKDMTDADWASAGKKSLRKFNRGMTVQGRFEIGDKDLKKNFRDDSDGSFTALHKGHQSRKNAIAQGVSTLIQHGKMKKKEASDLAVKTNTLNHPHTAHALRSAGVGTKRRFFNKFGKEKFQAEAKILDSLKTIVENAAKKGKRPAVKRSGLKPAGGTGSGKTHRTTAGQLRARLKSSSPKTFKDA